MSPELRCPKCGRALDLVFGRHAQKWWVDHPGAPYFGRDGGCLYAGKKWLHCDTEALAIAAFESDNSNWREASPEIVEIVNRLIEVEIDKNRRETRKGYARG